MKEFLNNNNTVTHEENIFKIFYILEERITKEKRTFKLYITFSNKKELLNTIKKYNNNVKNKYIIKDFEILEEL